jgi:hypothetical protein
VSILLKPTPLNSVGFSKTDTIFLRGIGLSKTDTTFLKKGVGSAVITVEPTPF